MTTSPPVRHTFRNVLLGLVAVLVLSLGLWATREVEPPPVAGAEPAPPPAGSLPVVAGLGGDFRLPSTQGGELALSSLRGNVVLLNFGFTSCAEVCPMVLTRLGNALRELERQGSDVSRVRPLFVTFDPERDTLEHLREYVGYFHPSLVGLRGDATQTAQAARQFNVLYLRVDGDSAGGYEFQHSDYIYVIDTVGRVRLLVGGNDPDAAIVEAVKTLLREGVSA